MDMKDKKEKKKKYKYFPYLIAAKRVKPQVIFFTLLAQPALIVFFTLIFFTSISRSFHLGTERDLVSLLEPIFFLYCGKVII